MHGDVNYYVIKKELICISIVRVFYNCVENMSCFLVRLFSIYSITSIQNFSIIDAFNLQLYLPYINKMCISCIALDRLQNHLLQPERKLMAESFFFFKWWIKSKCTNQNGKKFAFVWWFLLRNF